MEPVRTGAREVQLYLDIAFISQYELDFETFEKRIDKEGREWTLLQIFSDGL